MPNLDVVVTDPADEPAEDLQVDKTTQGIEAGEENKEDEGTSKPESTEEDQKSDEDKKLLGKSPEEITKEEAVKAALKSDEQVEILRQRVKELESASTPVTKTDEEKEEESDADREDAEQAAAIAALKAKGFATKDEIIAELKAERVLDEKTNNTISKMADIVDKYKDTPLKVTLTELTDYMEQERQTDPEKAFKLMKYDAMVKFEAAKANSKDPVNTESDGKEPYIPPSSTPAGMSKFNVNNPNIDAVLEEEVGTANI